MFSRAAKWVVGTTLSGGGARSWTVLAPTFQGAASRAGHVSAVAAVAARARCCLCSRLLRNVPFMVLKELQCCAPVTVDCLPQCCGAPCAAQRSAAQHSVAWQGMPLLCCCAWASRLRLPQANNNIWRPFPAALSCASKSGTPPTTFVAWAKCAVGVQSSRMHLLRPNTFFGDKDAATVAEKCNPTPLTKTTCAQK